MFARRSGMKRVDVDSIRGRRESHHFTVAMYGNRTDIVVTLVNQVFSERSKPLAQTVARLGRWPVRPEQCAEVGPREPFGARNTTAPSVVVSSSPPRSRKRTQDLQTLLHWIDEPTRDLTPI
jgi:hypothetical protein